MRAIQGRRVDDGLEAGFFMEDLLGGGWMDGWMDG
jgi:hypothetical protein